MISIVPLAEISVGAKTSADFSTSEDGINLICSLEGFHSKCYSDYAQSSIGYGTKCSGSSTQPHKSGSHSITKAKAMEALKKELKTAESNVRKQTKGIQMNQKQFDALVSFCYNTGGGNNYISNSPLVKYLNGKLSEKEARSKYAEYYIKAGGNVLQGLINRRKKEAEYFFGGSNRSDNSINKDIGTYLKGLIGTTAKEWGSVTGTQCVELPKYYIEKYYGKSTKSLALGNGNKMYEYVPKTFPSLFEKVSYYNGFVPQVGDIISYHSSTSPQYGHAAVVYAVNGKKYSIIEQWKGSGTVRSRTLNIVAGKYGVSYSIIGAARPTSNKPSKITVTANPVTASKTTNNSTEFSVGISPEANVEKIGVFYGTNKSDINGITTSTKHEKTSKHNYYLLAEWANGKKKSGYSFDTAKKTTKNGWTIKFDKDKTYHYKFVVKTTDGRWWISGRNSFTTGNASPAAITNLSVSNTKIGIGSSTTVTWKKSSKATEYLFSVINDEVGYMDERTIYGVDSTAVQTFALNTAGTYTASVSAKNSSGTSSTVSTTFEVMPDLTVTFDSRIGDPEIRMAHYNKEITTPNAPDREGYRFDGWKNDATGGIVKSATKIANVRDEATYSAIWTPKNYTVNIVDGITNKTLKTTSQPFDSEFNVTEFMENTTLPTHEFYEFAGYSEEIYKVKAETHTIYARYKWASEYNLGTTITSIKRAKSVNNDTHENDGYSIDIKVTAPKSSDEMGTDQTLKGRVVVALKTDAGRLLIETESAAFVLYPKENEPVTRTINVFVPYETVSDEVLPTAIEAYVVNNYYTAGIVSNIATNNEALAETNSTADQWLAWSEPVTVGQQLPDGTVVGSVSPDHDYYTYDIQTTTTKESTNSSLDGYTLKSSRWSDVPQWKGEVLYVKNWPSLVSNGGDKYDNTRWTGKEFYTRYNKTPVQASESANEKIVTSEYVCDYIYYHWCNNRNNGDLNHNVTGHKSKDANGNWKYTTFHCFSLSPGYRLSRTHIKNDRLDKDVFVQTLTGESKWYRDRCNDSKYWISEFPVYHQDWANYKKIFTFENQTINDTERNLKTYLKNPDEIPVPSVKQPDPIIDYYPVNNITLNTRINKDVVNVKKWYAYKPENKSIKHVDKNQIDISSYTVNGIEEEKEATLYIYKSTQVSDFTTEYIGNVVISSNGQILNPDTNEPITEVQTREEISDYTGDYTIAVAVKGETNAMIVGTISAPKPESYKVTFVNATDETDENGNIVYNTISEQNVVPGGSAVLPDESDIPVKKGYHFVCWNLSTDIVNGDMTVQAIYDKNDYAVVFVDWDSKKLEIKKFKYGETFVAPELPKPADDVDVEWVIGDADDENAVLLNEWLENGNVVTEDMIISARYSLKKFNLKVINLSNEEKPNDAVRRIENAEDVDEIISDFDSNNKDMEYGDIVQLEEYEEDYSSADIIFMGWKNAETGEYLDDIEIKSDMTIYPVYQFADTVEMPTASVTTGEYTSAQTVTLSCETENAVIYYTTDGTDPEYSDSAVEYTEPITLVKPTNLQFCAMAMGMNNSGTVAELYAINTATSGVKYHLVTIYSNLPQEEGAFYQELVPDSKKLDVSVFGSIEGYLYDGLYFDAEGEDEFYPASDLITSETTLYAIYTPKQFTTTFNDYDGTIISTSTVDYATAAEAPTPTREGYVFIGWDSDDFEYMTADKSFTAQYCLESEYATVSISRPVMSVEEGSESRILNAKVTPAELSDTELLWESDNPDVVSVYQNGLCEFLNEGSATITVTVIATGESAECFIAVLPNADKSIYLRDGSILNIDEQGYLRRIPKTGNTVNELKPNFANDETKLFFFDNSNVSLTDKDLVGTGSVVKLMDGETVLDEITAIMTGDFDGNGRIQNRDVSMMAQHVINTRDASEVQAIAVDVNGDGEVNVRDCAMVSRYLVGKEELE